MDIVLEFCDTFLFDKVYAKAFPASLEKYIPETPAFIVELADFITNRTEAVSDSTTKLGLHSLFSASNETIKKVKNVYGINASYHFVEESIYAHQSLFERSNLIRQAISLFLVMTFFGWILYFGVAALSYHFVYDKTNFNHPRYLKNQMSLEITQAMTSIPVMVLMTVPWFLLELHGYSKLYYNIDESTGGWWALAYQIPSFIMFTDCGIYFIHRWLHWPSVYKVLHKPHHKWIVCTPFASHAFHPVDGYAQSLPYHWFPFLFPLHKVLYLLLFTFVNFWTVMIHDGEYMSNDPVINGAACHTIHHLYFNYNYGQFTTLWDRLGGSYRQPDKELFNKQLKKDKKVWAKQTIEMDTIRDVVEGEKDFREYGTEEILLKKRPQTNAAEKKQ
ncbi:hypothetical protein CANARDRAFT_9075 [[Candida] arabinofermentans NRRL YB-2248]|uniref:Fatty acid hydroxylase domain-containing protein n=1 Tax=[Candida] arabinofermentans NRRL YB-2248 TaxID=983967 RepID=A0A1E4SXA4_9ASCO|nr:hypothetical protein CANARDRAFT_9075 [[Candida] arabinofermentans NRRL YB-2248]